MDNNQDKDISYMEDEGEQDIDIDDKSIEANTVDNEHKCSALESNPVPSTNSFKNYLNLPDIPFYFAHEDAYHHRPSEINTSVIFLEI